MDRISEEALVKLVNRLALIATILFVACIPTGLAGYDMLSLILFGSSVAAGFLWFALGPIYLAFLRA